MRRFWILITLTVFILTGTQVAFGAGEKDRKGEYQKQIETKLKEFKQKMEELNGKAVELKENAKKEFDKEMKVFQKKQESTNQKLKQLKSESTKAWEKAKAEMDSAIDELEKQYNKMVSRFKKT